MFSLRWGWSSGVPQPGLPKVGAEALAKSGTLKLNYPIESEFISFITGGGQPDQCFGGVHRTIIIMRRLYC